MALTKRGQGFMIGLGILVLIGAKFGWDYLHPKKAKNVTVKTKATSLPPLAYDKNSNAPFHKVPDFGNFASVETPVIRGHLMEWYAQSGLIYSVGGTQTTVGSICEELKVNIALEVQNSCTKQAEDLYAFADELHSGNPNPTKGCHFTIWMGDGAPSYLPGLNKRLKKDFGDEYVAKVIDFVGASNGEDKWLVKNKFAKDARGSLTVTVVRDGDWNIAIMKSQLMGWPVNYQDGTFDLGKVNFYPAPNDDYLQAAAAYVAGTKVTLKLVKDGKFLGRDTTLAFTGVSSWFPADKNAVAGKGGLTSLASTKDFGSQMASSVIFISKWASENAEAVSNMIAAFGLGGDQVKSHKEALEYAVKAGKEVFKSELTEEEILKAYGSYDITDDDGNVVNVGGSRVFNLADAANYTGIAGGQDKYKIVYNTFGNIDIEAYPELVPEIVPYDEAVDYQYLRTAYNKYKSKAGNVSKVDFENAKKTNEVVGNTSYSIEFTTGSATIKPLSYPILDKIYAQLNIGDNLFVDIEGHTDNSGSDEVNIPLSKQRAEAVRQYFLSKDPTLAKRLDSDGYGSTRPILDNSTELGRSKNRRVEIKLSRSN